MIDLYTKAVLTIIAAALLALAFQGMVAQSMAQMNAIQKVQICDPQKCAAIVPGAPGNGWALAVGG